MSDQKKLFEEFPPITTEQWESVIEKDLKGADYDKKLVWKTAEGFSVRPYYRSENLDSVAWINALPDEFPYIRGNKEKGNNWLVCQDITVTDYATANKKALDAISRGAEAISFKLEYDKLYDTIEISGLLNGIDAKKVELSFYNNKYHLPLLEMLSKIPGLHGSLNYDPLTRYIRRGTWFVTENTHEALVSPEQFELAEHYLGENTKSNAANPAFRHSIFGGVAYCASCGAAMCSGGSVYKGEREKYWYLVCNNLSSRSTHRCEAGARIRYDDLVEIVRRDLEKLIRFSVEETEEITRQAVERARELSGEADVPKQLRLIEKQLENSGRMLERMYRDNASGILSDEQLESMARKLSDEMKELNRRSAELRSGRLESDKVRDAYTEFFELAKKYAHIEKLDRDILHTFIERIEVSKKVLPEGRKVASHKSSCYSQNIRIFYRFVGELHNLPEKALDIAENY